MGFKITGQVYEFGFQEDFIRRYTVITVPFEAALKYFKPRKYSAIDGEGEQREIFQKHAAELKLAMAQGEFTPTTATVGTTEEQRLRLLYEDTPVNWGHKMIRNVHLELEDDESLPLLDYGHRMHALKALWDAGNEVATIQPVTAVILLDGDPKIDFMNLQKGKGVDKSHIISMSVQQGAVDRKSIDFLTIGMEAAKILNERKDSPFYDQIKFDTVSQGRLPIATLMPQSRTDIVLTLTGGGKICKTFGRNGAWLAETIIDTYVNLFNKVPELFDKNKPLLPPPEGTKGGATMLVGVANMMAWRLSKLEKARAEPSDIKFLTESARKTFNGKLQKQFPAALKRELLGKFSEWFLHDLGKEKLHAGIPISLCELFKYSSFNKTRPKPVRKKLGRPKVKAVEIPQQEANEVRVEIQETQVAPWEEISFES